MQRMTFFGTMMVLCMTGLLTACSTRSVMPAPPRTITKASSPVALFQGYDSVSGAGLSTAVGGTSQANGGESYSSVTVCTDFEQIEQALNVNASMSASYAGIGSVEAKVDFLNELHLTKNSTSIVVYARHVAASQAATNVNMTPGVKVPSDAASAKQFFRSYGDSYISGVTTGGEYYAVYTFYSVSKEEKSELSTELSAKGIVSSLNLSADVKTKLTDFLKNEHTRSSFEQKVSGIANPALPTEDGAADYARGFVKEYLDSPTVIDYQVAGYERVPGMTDAFNPIAFNRAVFTGDNMSDIGINGELAQTMLLLNQIDAIRDIYRAYGGFKDSKLDNARTQTKTDLRTLASVIRAYELDPLAPVSEPTLASYQLGTPSLRFKLPIVGSRDLDIQVSGGVQFDDMSLLGMSPVEFLGRHMNIRSIRLGPSLCNFTVVYAGDNAQQTVPHGSSSSCETTTSPLILSAGNNITGFAGTTIEHGVLRRLKLTSSVGQSIESSVPIPAGVEYYTLRADYKPVKPVLFDDTWDSDKPTVVAMRGTYGSDKPPYGSGRLYGLTLVGVTFQPASWDQETTQ